jgi:hypothetical protein
VGFGVGGGVGVAAFRVGPLEGVCVLPLGETGLVPLICRGLGVGVGATVCVLRRGRESASREANTARQHSDTTKSDTKTMNGNFVEVDSLQLTRLVLLMRNRRGVFTSDRGWSNNLL